MVVEFEKKFAKDLKKIKQPKDQKNVKAAINSIRGVKVMKDVFDLPKIKKLSGHSKLYRIRAGDYRVGFSIEGETLTFIRVLPRNIIYNYFPEDMEEVDGQTIL